MPVPAEQTTLAVDISNYTGGLTPETARAMYEGGVRRAIVQFVRPDQRQYVDQISALRGAGIEVEGYVYLWFSSPIEWAVNDRVEWACAEAALLGLKRMWLDCEQSMENDPPFDYVTQPTSPHIRAAIAKVREYRLDPGIYTAKWWWVPGVSDSREFSQAGIPLWNANYDEDRDIDDADFGGWTVPLMEQFQGWGDLAGVTGIDLNSYMAAQPGIPSPVANAIRELREIRGHVDAALAELGG